MIELKKNLKNRKTKISKMYKFDSWKVKSNLQSHTSDTNVSVSSENDSTNKKFDQHSSSGLKSEPLRWTYLVIPMRMVAFNTRFTITSDQDGPLARYIFIWLLYKDR